MDFTEMSNEELFLVLTGDRGVIAQAQLNEILKSYRETHHGFKNDSLKETVCAYMEEQEVRN